MHLFVLTCMFAMNNQSINQMKATGVSKVTQNSFMRREAFCEIPSDRFGRCQRNQFRHVEVVLISTEIARWTLADVVLHERAGRSRVITVPIHSSAINTTQQVRVSNFTTRLLYVLRVQVT